MSNERSEVLVIGPDMWETLGADAVVAWFETQPHRRHVVVRYDLTAREIHRVAQICQAEIDVRPSCRQYHSLTAHLIAGGSEWVTSPAERLMRKSALLLSPEDARLMEALIFACEQAIGMDAAASAVGTTARKLPLKLRRLRKRFANLPTFPRLVAHLAALHALWVLEMHNWSVERATERAGFDDTDAFNLYVWRSTGATIGRLKSQGGYRALEGLWWGWFECANQR